jgi:LytS/YehU family sensor histidine kinase
VRFGDRLQVSSRVSDAARTAAVPVLLLQPLVENAIQHGVSRRAGTGRIDIDAHTTNDRLLITIHDDGEGVSDAALGGRERVGLGNTRARLEALYASDHRLSLANAPQGGAELTVDLPLRRAAPTA